MVLDSINIQNIYQWLRDTQVPDVHVQKYLYGQWVSSGIEDIQYPEQLTYFSPTPVQAPNFDYIVQVPDGGVFDENGNLVMQDGTFIHYPRNRLFRFMQSTRELLEQHFPFYHEACSKKRHLEGTAATLVSPWGHIYAHWILDVLPKWMFLEKSGLEFDYLLINPLAFSYMREIGEVFDMPLDKAIPVPCHEMVSAETLLIPVYGQFPFRKEFVQWIRKKLTPHPVPTRRVYISRAGAAHRKVLNEEEIIPILHRYGFEIVRMEELTFQEQVNLLSETQILMGIQGSGLYNMLFLPPGSMVFEIVNRQYAPDYFSFTQFLELSRNLQLTHQWFFANDSRESANPREYLPENLIVYADVNIPLGPFNTFLAEMENNIMQEYF